MYFLTVFDVIDGGCTMCPSGTYHAKMLYACHLYKLYGERTSFIPRLKIVGFLPDLSVTIFYGYTTLYAANAVAYGICVDGVGGGFGDYEVANVERFVGRGGGRSVGGKEFGGCPEIYVAVFR